MMDKKKLSESLKRLEEMLRHLHATTRNGGWNTVHYGSEPFTIFTRQQGGVSLTGNDAIAYWQLVEDFADLVPSEQYGPSSIQAAVQDAIVHVVHGTNLEPDIKVALQNVRGALQIPLKPWKILLPVRGLKVDARGLRIGQAKFIALTDSKLRAFRRQSGVSKANRKIVIPDDIPDRVFAEVVISAADSEAAQTAAARRARQSVAVLNFYASFLAYGEPRAYFPGERHSALTVWFTQEPGKNWVGMGHRRTDPLGVVDCRQVVRDAGKGGFALIDRVLRQSSPNQVERRLINAFEAAGRATNAISDDTALLHTVTALETAMIGSQNRGEIGYRLRTRVARLLGRDANARRQIGKSLNVVYSARSKLSHAGVGDVAPRDLATALVNRTGMLGERIR